MRRKYDLEFKIEAVKLASEKGNAVLVERNLNIGKGCIYRWKKEIKLNKTGSFLRDNSENFEKKKIKQLERENKRLRRERDILKKAVHVFTEDPDRYSDL